MLDQHLPQVAYQLKLNSEGKIVWLDYQSDGKIIEYEYEPFPTYHDCWPIEWMM